MAKGKFTKHGSDSGNPMEPGHFPWSSDLDATSELPDLEPQYPDDAGGTDFPDGFNIDDRREIDPANPSAMPEVDFHNVSDQELDDFSWDSISEMSSLELEDPPRKPPAQDPPDQPSEEEAIREAFQQVVEKEPPKHRPAAKKPPHRNPKRKKHILLFSALALAAVVLISTGSLLISRLTDPYNHRILSGVLVSGVNVGGMTRREAETAVSGQVQPVLESTDMVLKLPEQTLTLSPRDTGVSLDVSGAVKEAYRYGRSGTQEEKEAVYRSSLTQTHTVDLIPFLELNRNYIKGQLKTYSLEHKSTYTPSSYALEGERPPLDFKRFHPNNTCQTLLLNLGTPGTELDPAAVLETILNAYASLNFTVTITPEQTGTVPEPLDLAKILDEVSVPPVDSSLDPETFEVISGSYGYTFNAARARELLAQAHYGDTVRVPMEYQAPEVMDEDVLFRDVLGEAETPHSNNENRNTNLRLACEAIDGLILYPGDEFSYNETLGQRTAEKGYKPAPAYSGTKLVDSVGGGICQVSSTLYLSAMLADLEITDRVNHGFLPTYIDPGMDATVSWGRPDFKFRNSGTFPVKIHAVATDSTVKIQILGTDDRDYYVKMEYQQSVIKHGTNYQTVPAGSGYSDGAVIQKGSDGYFVKTFRCKYDKQTGELISREQEAISNYPAQSSIVISVISPDRPDSTETPSTPGETVPPVTSPVPPTGPAPDPTPTPTVPQGPAEGEQSGTPEPQQTEP